MHSKHKPLLVVGAVSALVTLFSAVSHGEKLTLDKCMRLAMEHSLEGKALKAKLASGQSGYKASLAALKPNVSLTSLGSSISRSDNGGTQVSSLSTALSINQPIGQLLPVDSSLANTSSISGKSSEIAWQKVQLEVGKNALDLQYKVREAYIGYLKAQAALTLNQEQHRRIEAYLLPEVKAKLEAGVATKVDQLTVESQLRNAELTVTKAEHSLIRAKEELTSLIGPVEEPLEIEPLRTGQEDGTSAKSVEDMKKRALSERIEIKLGELSLEQAKLSAKKARLDNSMYVTLGTEYDRTWRDQNLEVKTSASLNSRDMALKGMVSLGEPTITNQVTTDWRISLSLASPILDWGQSQAEIRRANEDIELASLNLEQTKASILDDVISAFHRYSEARDSLSVVKMNLQAAESALSITQARYDAGAASNSDLLDSQLDLFEAQSSVIQSEYELLSTLDQIGKAMGEKKGADVVPSK